MLTNKEQEITMDAQKAQLFSCLKNIEQELTKICQSSSSYNQKEKESCGKIITVIKDLFTKHCDRQDELVIQCANLVVRALESASRRFENRHSATSSFSKLQQFIEELESFLAPEPAVPRDILDEGKPKQKKPSRGEHLLEVTPAMSEQEKSKSVVMQHELNKREDFQKALTKIGDTALTEHWLKAKRIFISYAWPIEDKHKEAWTREFVKLFKRHLEAAGLIVDLDQDESGFGTDMFKFMTEKISNADHVLVICDRTMQYKYEVDGATGVFFEYLQVVRRWREQQKPNFVIPICLNEESFIPGLFAKAAEISVYKDGYLSSLKQIIRRSYGFNEAQFEKLWPEDLTEKSNVVSLHSQRAPSSSAASSNTTSAVALQNHGIFSSASSSSASASDPMLELRQLVNAVKQAYLAKEWITNGIAEPMPIKEGFIRLAIVKETEQRRKEQKELALEGERSNRSGEQDKDKPTFNDKRVTSFEEIYGTKEPIPVEAIFKAGPGEAAIHRVLVSGRAGIGKSTLCQHLAYRWAQSQTALWQDQSYQLVVWVPLRNLALYETAECDLFHVILKECIGENHLGEKACDISLVRTALKKIDPTKVLYVLDGVDEVSQLACELAGRETAQGKLIRQLLSQSRVIITSRPYRIEEYLASNPQKIDRKLETIGFLSEDIDKYIEAFFGKGLDQEPLNQSLKEFLNKNPNIKGIAHIPINLSLICRAWKSHGGKLINTNSSQHMTMTQLYFGLLTDLSSRYLRDKCSVNPNDELSVEVLEHPQCKPILLFLAEVAFEQMQETGLIIEPQKIRNLLKRYSGIKLTEVIAFGLLKPIEDSVHEQQKPYYFIHLTFQEFLTAFWISKKLKQADGNAPNAMEQFIKQHKYDREYEMVWWFVAGLLKDDQPTLERFFDILEAEPRDLVGLYHQTLIMRCFDECCLQVSEPRKARYINNIIRCIDFEDTVKKLSFSVVNHYLALSQNVLNQPQIINLFLSLLKADKNKSLFPMLESLRLHFTLPRKIVDRLMDLLRDNDYSICKYAMLALENLSVLPSGILNRLMESIRDGGMFTSDFAARVLTYRSELPLGILNGLSDLLDDENNYVRESAAIALCRRRSLPLTILNRLIDLLRDKDNGVRNQSVLALGNQSELPLDILNRLGVLLQDEESDIREEAARVLSNQSVLPPAILNHLGGLLQNEANHVRKSAAIALSRQSVLPLTILNHLVDLLRDKESQARRDVAWTLWRQLVLPLEILNRLGELLQDEDNDVCESAVIALCRQSVIPLTILNRLVDLLQNKYSNVRRHASCALRNQSALALKNQSVFSPYSLYRLGMRLKDEDSDVRKKAAGALSIQAVLPFYILNWLANLLRDKARFVREAAAYTLSKQSELPLATLNILISPLENIGICAEVVPVLTKQSLRYLLKLIHEENKNQENPGLLKILILKTLTEKIPVYVEGNNIIVGNRERTINFNSVSELQQCVTSLKLQLAELKVNFSGAGQTDDNSSSLISVPSTISSPSAVDDDNAEEATSNLTYKH